MKYLTLLLLASLPAILVAVLPVPIPTEITSNFDLPSCCFGPGPAPEHAYQYAESRIEDKEPSNITIQLSPETVSTLQRFRIHMENSTSISGQIITKNRTVTKIRRKKQFGTILVNASRKIRNGDSDKLSLIQFDKFNDTDRLDAAPTSPTAAIEPTIAARSVESEPIDFWNQKLRHVLFQSMSNNTSTNGPSPNQIPWNNIYSAPMEFIDPKSRKLVPGPPSHTPRKLSGLMVNSKNGIELRTTAAGFEALASRGEAATESASSQSCSCHLVNHGETVLAYWSVEHSPRDNTLEYLIYPVSYPHSPGFVSPLKPATTPILEPFHVQKRISKPSPIDLNPYIGDYSHINEIPFQASLGYGAKPLPQYLGSQPHQQVHHHQHFHNLHHQEYYVHPPHPGPGAVPGPPGQGIPYHPLGPPPPGPPNLPRPLLQPQESFPNVPLPPPRPELRPGPLPQVFPNSRPPPRQDYPPVPGQYPNPNYSLDHPKSIQEILFPPHIPPPPPPDRGNSYFYADNEINDNEQLNYDPRNRKRGQRIENGNRKRYPNYANQNFRGKAEYYGTRPTNENFQNQAQFLDRYRNYGSNSQTQSTKINEKSFENRTKVSSSKNNTAGYILNF